MQLKFDLGYGICSKMLLIPTVQSWVPGMLLSLPHSQIYVCHFSTYIFTFSLTIPVCTQTIQL